MTAISALHVRVTPQRTFDDLQTGRLIAIFPQFEWQQNVRTAGLCHFSRCPVERSPAVELGAQWLTRTTLMTWNGSTRFRRLAIRAYVKPVRAIWRM
jgi:hypothetical protein